MNIQGLTRRSEQTMFRLGGVLLNGWSMMNIRGLKLSYIIVRVPTIK